MSISLSTHMASPFDDAVRRTREALAGEGFGVLTEIDIKATLKTELDVDVDDYLILGACNAALAHQAIRVDPQIGLLHPCNVVVRTDPADPGVVIVEGMNPAFLVQLIGEAELAAIADEVTAKLGAAIAKLAPKGR